MKKYLFLAIALLGLASCAKDDLADGNKPIHSGEVEESYIAINLAASDITRAQTGFEDGTAEERAVSHVDFFFFDAAGNAFPVKVNNPNDGTTTEPGGSVNHLRAVHISFSPDTNNGDDISDSSNAVLLLRTYKGQYPSQIVAVLNWSPNFEKSYTLGELHDAVDIQGTFKNSANVDTKYFVMSNAVYAQGTNEVCATTLTMENIKTTQLEAEAAPVTIYVERVAAKVQLTANEKYDLDKDVQFIPVSGDPTPTGVNAKIIGWDLYRDNSQSYLLKRINPTVWGVDGVGFSWNDAPWYRCYWATSIGAPEGDLVYNDDSSKTLDEQTYIGENTTGKATCTKAVIKAQLVNDNDKPLDIAIWNNVEYVEEPNNEKGTGYTLRIAVANTLKNTYFAMTTTSGGVDEYTGLKPEDLKCVAGGTNDAPTGVLANEVYFQLSDTGKAKNWYKLVNGKYEPVAADTANDNNSIKATNEALKKVPAAVLYTNGMTFYYVDIKHLGAQASQAEYGIVRNHIYDIDIKSIKGYGSPIYAGVNHLDYPQITEQQTYVSAKINILSWRLVHQEVNIQPNN